jgi:hypothetical protein
MSYDMPELGHLSPHHDDGKNVVHFGNPIDLSAFAQGDYQCSILAGNEAWSGTGLRGKAKQYASSYAGSRRTLLVRIRDAGVPVAFAKYGPRRRKVLVVGEWFECTCGVFEAKQGCMWEGDTPVCFECGQHAVRESIREET